MELLRVVCCNVSSFLELLESVRSQRRGSRNHAEYAQHCADGRGRMRASIKPPDWKYGFGAPPPSSPSQ